MYFLISLEVRKYIFQVLKGIVKPSQAGYVGMEGTDSCHSRDPRKCPLFPLREAEVLLLSTAWFTDIYLDISGGLGTLSTVQVFSSVHYSFSGFWAQGCTDHLKSTSQLKITPFLYSKTHMKFSYQQILLIIVLMFQ